MDRKSKNDRQTMAKKKDKKTNNEKTGKDHFQLQFKLGGL